MFKRGWPRHSEAHGLQLARHDALEVQQHGAGLQQGQPLGRALLTALLVSLLIHFVFYKLLRVPLPWGILVNHTW